MKMTALLINAILQTNVASLRLMVQTLDCKALLELNHAIVKIADKMDLATYVKYDMESKIQELSYLATI
jgi:hypothetical protein